MPTAQAGVGLGRVFNTVPIAAGQGLYMGNVNAISFLCTGNDTFTLSIATTFAGTYRASNFFTPNWTPITYYYTQAATNGTAAWVRATQAAAAAVTIASNTVLFTVFTPQVPDTYKYVKCSVGASGLVTAILHDLAVQRAPANLQIVGA